MTPEMVASVVWLLLLASRGVCILQRHHGGRWRA
jgi:hypothetical protein